MSAVCGSDFWLLTGPKLALYAGVLSLGAGDTAAGLVGMRWGRRKWPSKLSSLGCDRVKLGRMNYFRHLALFPSLTW